VFQKGLESWRVIPGTTVFSGAWIFVVTFFTCKFT
jgi:hypothetical protein